MSKTGKKRVKKVVLIIVLVIAIAFASCFSFRVVRDTANVGLDYITFEHPLEKISSDKMLANIEQANAKLNHPFVLVTDSDFSRVKSEYNSNSGDEYIKSRIDFAIERAEELMDEPCLAYELDEDGILLETSRQVLNRVMTLAGLWHITGDERYAQRAYAELDSACNFPDWHDSHFLDVAEMSFAVALGYDWLYDYLDDAQKTLLAQKTFEYGIDKADTKKIFSNWWAWSKVNWNTQCYGGMGVACMVFSDYCPEEASELLSSAYYWMPLHFKSFSPDGAYVEGNSYWEAMSSYLTYFISTSRNYFGSDFGLSELSGYDKIGYFPLYISAPQGVFNFGDNRNLALYAPSVHYFAREYNEPLLTYYQMQANMWNDEVRESVLSALWYDMDMDLSEEKLGEVPLAVHMKSDAGEEFVTVRSSYCNTDATYIGMKGGYNYSNHGDLDIGSFVFDALGERWILDLGKSSYSSPGYFNGLVGGGRWKVYTKRAEGHNTLVINPSKTAEDQYPFARAGFTDFAKGNGTAAATLDMTEAYYRHGVSSVKRTLDVSDDCKTVSITDEVSCKKSSDIIWGAHTDANVEIIDDGKTARLTKESDEGTIKTVLVRINDDIDARFSVINHDEISDVGKEMTEQEKTVTKLVIQLNNVQEATIKVTFEPQYIDGE